MIDEGDDGALRVDELVPADGGQWRGLLFDNPVLGLAPQLTWSFTFPFQAVSRDHGDSPVTLDIDWLPLRAESWRGLAGQHVSSGRFAEPGEASLYYFTHYRYHEIDLDVVEQRDLDIRVRVTVRGDLDGLGVEPVRADSWLRFTGIIVSLHDTPDADAALARLREFTDTTGLAPATEPSGIRHRFAPSSW